MQLKITSPNLELNDKHKQMIDEKLTQKIDNHLQSFASDLKTADLSIDKDRYENYNVRFDMSLPGKKNIYAKNSHKRLVSAIIGLREQLLKQIKKYKADLSNYSVG